MFRSFRPKRSRTIWMVATTITLLLVVSGGMLYAHRRYQSSVAQTVPSLTPAQFQQQVATLTSLMKTKGITAAFTYTEAQISASPSFAKDCHPLLHELGHAAYTYYGGYAQAMQHNNEICDSGYTHGVLESYLGSGIDIQQALQS